jgi:hypothetical protein
LPALGPDQQPVTAPEGRSLILAIETTDLPDTLGPLRDGVIAALDAVTARDRTPEEFFDDVGSVAPSGAVVTPYLVCPIELGRQCRANALDLVRFLDECKYPGTVVFTAFVERDDAAWAGAGVCVWSPTPDELTFVEASIVNTALAVFAARHVPYRRDPELDGYVTAMAHAKVTHPSLGSAADLDEYFENRDRIAERSGHAGYLIAPVGVITPVSAGPGGRVEQWVDASLDWDDIRGSTQFGIGTALGRGKLVTYYVILP